MVISCFQSASPWRGANPTPLLNNNICLKEGKALYSADFASLCGRKRHGYSARTPEGLRTYSARTPQVLRNYSMNPIALVVWYRSMLSHNSTHQSLRDWLLGRNVHPHPPSFPARVPPRNRDSSQKHSTAPFMPKVQQCERVTPKPTEKRRVGLP